MLTQLQLNDLVLVDRAELELQTGLTALTGETGAGKSIVVDALLLIAGGRATGDIVRQGAQRAEVNATFAALSPPAFAWLKEQSIACEGDLVVRRVIGQDGRSRAYVNGQSVPLQSLRELAECLLDIHGQQEFQRLLSRAAQREALDQRLSDGDARRATAELYARHQAALGELNALNKRGQDRDARAELLDYQLQELDAEVGTADELEALSLDQKRIASRGRLAAAARTALDCTYEAEEVNALALIGRAQAALKSAADMDPDLQAAARLLTEAAILTQEASQTLRHYLEALDVDPAQLEEIERRTAALETLARKHRVTLLDLPSQREQLRAERTAIDRVQLDAACLQNQLASLRVEYLGAASALSRARQAAARQVGEKVTALMQTLGMAGGSFEVAVRPSEAQFGPHGCDEIEFLVSANPGQALQGLAKVASGGELSRISLALQVAGAAARPKHSSSLCMVFDEVDAGIGGGVAEIVGQQLRKLGERAQVLCVTHLAQVAAQAHGHFRVSKLTAGNLTRTVVTPLGPDERVEEVARMLGGVRITDQARRHASEMLTERVRARR